MASGDGAGADMSCHFLQRAGVPSAAPGGPGAGRDGREARRPGTGASDQWIVVSSWWKFNGLLMSRFSGSREAARSVPRRSLRCAGPPACRCRTASRDVAALDERDRPPRAPSDRRVPPGRPRHSPRPRPSGRRRTAPDGRARRRTRPAASDARRRAYAAAHPGHRRRADARLVDQADQRRAARPCRRATSSPARSEEPMPSSQLRVVHEHAAGQVGPLPYPSAARAQHHVDAARSRPSRSARTACSTSGRPPVLQQRLGAPAQPPAAAGRQQQPGDGARARVAFHGPWIPWKRSWGKDRTWRAGSSPCATARARRTWPSPAAGRCTGSGTPTWP